MSFDCSLKTPEKTKEGTIGPPLAYTLAKDQNTEDI